MNGRRRRRWRHESLWVPGEQMIPYHDRASKEMAQRFALELSKKDSRIEELEAEIAKLKAQLVGLNRYSGVGRG